MIKLDEYHLYSEEKDIQSIKSQYDLEMSFEKSLKSIDAIDCTYYKCRTLVCGAMTSFDRHFATYLYNWYRHDKSIILLAEVSSVGKRIVKRYLSIPYIITPYLFASGIRVTNIKITKELYYKELCKKLDLNTIAEHVKKLYLDIDASYSYVYTYYAYKYIEMLFNRISPRKVIVWNEFTPFHKLMYKICRKYGINIEFMEFGALPGTYSIDGNGQLGESTIANLNVNYERKQIDKVKYEQATGLIEDLYCTGANRYIQIKELFDIKKLLYFNPKKKTIVFWGQNDEESGLVPYTRNSKKYHSKLFHSSIEAMEYMRNLAYKLDCNYIFKPHPIWTKRHVGEVDKYKDIDVVCDINVNYLVDLADLNVTISSQMAYVSLVRNKPVLILGINELSNKECCYSVKHKKAIRNTTIRAIKAGLTEKQRRNFVTHVAYLMNYYLYTNNRFRNSVADMESIEYEDNSSDAN